MKHTAVLLFPFLSLFSLVCAAKPYLITYYFPNGSSQTDISIMVKPAEGSPLVYKTAVVKNYAVFSFELAEPAPAYLLLEENDGEEIDFFLDSTSIEFVIHPGKPLKVQVFGSGSMQRWKDIKTNLEKIIGGDTLWSYSQLNSHSVTLSDVLNMRDTISTQVKVGYYGSICATYFGRMMPVITVQNVPVYSVVDYMFYGSNDASVFGQSRI